ncbi:MAG TPA: hypothetical protein DCF43_06380 [Pseudomonas sp.]|nr:hypothetical protein [Pseudomonas sp.]
MAAKELSHNDKLAIMIIMSSDDPDVLREVRSDPCYANLQPHLIDHVSVEQSPTTLFQSNITNQGNDFKTKPLDEKQSKADAKHMNTITREEIDLKIAGLEIKTEARMQAIDAKLDAFLSVQAEREKAIDGRLGRIETSITSLSTSVTSLTTLLSDMRVDVAKIEGSIIKWVLGTGIAIIGTTFAILRYFQ